MDKCYIYDYTYMDKYFTFGQVSFLQAHFTLITKSKDGLSLFVQFYMFSSIGGVLFSQKVLSYNFTIFLLGSPIKSG